MARGVVRSSRKGVQTRGTRVAEADDATCSAGATTDRVVVDVDRVREPPCWSARGGDLVTAYTAAVEHLIRDQLETAETQRALSKTMSDVQSWRTEMESLARLNRAKNNRDVLLQAAGYGLGSPRSRKEMDSFLLEVEQRVALHKKTLEALGAAAIAFPTSARAAVTAGRKDVAREKAEDSSARKDLAEHRADLIAYLRDTKLAVRAIAARAERADDRDTRKAVSELEVALIEALTEARIQARRAVVDKPVPPELVSEPESDDDTGSIHMHPHRHGPLD